MIDLRIKILNDVKWEKAAKGVYDDIKNHKDDAGFDLYFPTKQTIHSGQTTLLKFDIACEMRDDYLPTSYMLVPRSSISKTPLRMANSIGIIDAGYRGEIMAAVDNISDEDYTIKVGQRLFQICSPVLAPVTFELTDRLSDLLFCPSKAAIKNLESEGYHNFKEKQVIFSGDIMFDTLSLFIKNLKLTNDRLKAPYIMVTVHRAENTDDPEKLKSIFLALHEISKKYLIKLVLHPRTKLKLNEFKIQISKNIKVISPLSYVENISLLNNSIMLITDSGGMQKESYFLKKKCLTLRDDTEWTELIDLKCNILTGSNKEKIINSFNKLIASNPDFSSQIYGDANSRFIIANKILNN